MQNKPKNIFFILLFLSGALIHLNAQDLFVQKTKYFDIIYSSASEKTAALISEHADNYAEEISQKLNRKIPKRMPIYIEGGKEALNGYYTFFPYRRIVLFDTIPEEGQLSNLNDVILKVFYHELTHAISLTYFFPLLPMSFTEGVAVSYESLDGEQGRLNDPLIMHSLMQARLENASPSWKEAAGARDVYPGGLWPYIYGGAFAEYLQKIYGMETYAKYWANPLSFFPKGKTKKIFNKELDKLWNSFLESIYFPEKAVTPQNPIKQKGGFSFTANSKEGFAYFDFTTKNVIFFPDSGKEEKLFTAEPSLSFLSFSQDGKFLLVSDLVNSPLGEHNRAIIFDMQKKKFLNKEYSSLRYASFCGETLCGVEIKSQFSELVLIDQESFEKKGTLLKAGPGQAYSAIYNPVFAGKNKIAFIAANGIKRDILIIDITSKEIKKIEFEQPLSAIRYLQSNNSEEEPVLSFSWADKNTLYRSAFLNLKTNELKVLEKDISGGTFFPIVKQKKETKEYEVIYTGVFTKYNSIYKIDSSFFTERKASLKSIDISNQEIKTKIPNTDILTKDKYNYFSWMHKPFPLPFIDFSGLLGERKDVPIGIKLYWNDPTNLLYFETLSLFYFKPFFYETSILLKAETRPANIKIKFYDENKFFKFRKIGSTIESDFFLPLNSFYHNVSGRAGLSIEGFSFFGSSYKKAKTLYGQKLGNPVLSEEISAVYTYQKSSQKLNTNFFTKDFTMFRAAAGLKHGFHFPSKTNAVALQTFAAFRPPVVPIKFNLSSYLGYNAFALPHTGDYGFFNSRALMGMASYLPDMSEYENVKKIIRPGKINYGFGFETEINILSYDIQTGSSWLPIFFNRVNMTAGYRVIFNFLNGGKNKADIYQSIYGKFYLTMNSVANIGIEYAHPLEKVKIGKFKAIVEIKF
ncbi:MULTISPECIES: hypothetical protein [unclassified Treponema]|uniref:hypothetical protein n=1 Tax=unclassified Treponema TaxID=2638727 RepID=UPI0020A40DD7|nr:MULTISPECIES: hypothetical protein [unclassified Treponema]UTC68361.1 hypothetical protein E4O06_06960 [Treponema sp. OMZ 789]UTC71081.1 hypothetical protein E4O01_07100 [Treponema sp. OMZ 790]UTC73822.1 hypothetical protein E4O02_07295 [Treponema sp. OMZ 791]